MFGKRNSNELPRRGEDGSPLFGAVIRKIQRGVDVEENFRVVFHRCNRLLHFFFVRQGVSTDRREDLVQETMLNVYRSIGQFEGEAEFDAWVLRIAGNVALGHARSERALKRSAQVVPLEQATVSNGARRVSPLVAPDPAPLDRALFREQEEVFERAIEELPEQMRQCATLRYRQGLRYHEIASLLEISLNSVRVQLWRARRRLKGTLAERLGTSTRGETRSGRERLEAMDPSVK